MFWPWAELHQEELMADWDLVMNGEEPFKIQPLQYGESGALDMKPYLDFGVFNRIKDYNSFKQVRVAFDTIEWKSGIYLSEV